MKKFTRRATLLAVGGATGYMLSSKLRPNLPTMSGTIKVSNSADPLLLNDASGLSATPVNQHLTIRDDYRGALRDNVRTALKEAIQSNKPLNVGAARHSMGGQAIPREGIALTFDNPAVEIDSDNSIYRVHAGARWSQVIAALDPQGWSPKVTQANNDFGVAATFSVNAHGWPVPFGPMGSTVRSIRMIMPSGELVECSAFQHMPAEDFSKEFKSAVENNTVKMAYGRVKVERDDFFNRILMRTYSEADNQSNLPAASGSGVVSKLSREIYRAQLGNETMKSFRWWNETVIGPKIIDGEITRNSVINEPVKTLADRNPDRTDIIHEYFVDFDRFDEFLSICREVIPASFQELLNVTLRYIDTDNESILAYATTPRIAAVMSFSQEMTQRAEADMQRMTQQLIERVLDIGGTYYLPYRPHATMEQFTRAYPNCEKFSTAKKNYDPDLMLRNNLWDTYLSRL